MRVPVTEFTEQPWRIHQITRDFEIEDVWRLPTPGGPDDFPKLVDGVLGGVLTTTTPLPVRLLMQARNALGAVFGWDRSEEGLGERVDSIRHRLPGDLRDRPVQHAAIRKFHAVYQTDDEWVAELANQTVHALLHLGWVPDGDDGRYTGLMTVLVKPAGLFGTTYMAAIKPFRLLVVYPALLRKVGRLWRDQASETRSA